MAKKEKRFIKTYSQGLGEIEIWVDAQTGVNYVYKCSGYGGGLTPLLDNQGNPIITPIIKEE